MYFGIGLYLIALIATMEITLYFYKKNPTLGMLSSSGFYVGSVLITELFANKLVFFFIGTVTGGVFVYAFTFVMDNMNVVLYGKKIARFNVILAFIWEIIFIMHSQLILNLPGPSLSTATGLDSVLTFTPRIIIASLIAFILSENTDIYLFSRYMDRFKNKLYLRTLIAIIPSLAVDSFVFVPIAFLFVVPVSVIWTIIATQLLAKYAIGVVIGTPYLYRIDHFARAHGHPVQSVEG